MRKGHRVPEDLRVEKGNLENKKSLNFSIQALC